MAPVAPLYSNFHPLLNVGVHATTIIGLLAAVGRFYYVAHRALPPSKHTRSRHDTERSRLPIFLALAAVSAVITIASEANWVVSSFYAWLHENKQYDWNPSGLVVKSSESRVPLGLWWEDAKLFQSYYYGILGNPTFFFLTFQNLVGKLIWSLFVGIEGRHRNIPYKYIVAFVLVAQFIGLSVSMNLFFAALTLVPVPLSSEDTHRLFPSVRALSLLPILGITWVASIPAYLDKEFWPYVCYVGYVAVPLILASFVQLKTQPWADKHSDLNSARKAYATVFQWISLYALTLYAIEVYGVLAKTHQVAEREAVQHSHFWLLQRKQTLSWSEHTWITLSKFLGTLNGGDAVISGILWDVLLSGTTLALWAYTRNIQVSSVLNCLKIGNWDTASADTVQRNTRSTRSTSSVAEASPAKKGRGRPRKSPQPLEDDGVEPDESGAYIPSESVKDEVDATAPLALSEDWEEQNTESGALAWGLFILGGLPTAMAAVLGGELSGG